MWKYWLKTHLFQIQGWNIKFTVTEFLYFSPIITLSRVVFCTQFTNMVDSTVLQYLPVMLLRYTIDLISKSLKKTHSSLSWREITILNSPDNIK